MPYTFLTGGARSGKSSAAERLAMASGDPVTVVATAEPRDDEMAVRITRHRATRPVEWETVEEPRELDAAIRGVAAGRFVIVDCLTLWVANLLDAADDAVVERTSVVVSELAARQGGAVVVSNEVGDGIVPADALARRYRDLLGVVNRLAAASAARAYLLVAGRAVPLERTPW